MDIMIMLLYPKICIFFRLWNREIKTRFLPFKMSEEPESRFRHIFSPTHQIEKTVKFKT